MCDVIHVRSLPLADNIFYDLDARQVQQQQQQTFSLAWKSIVSLFLSTSFFLLFNK